MHARVSITFAAAVGLAILWVPAVLAEETTPGYMEDFPLPRIEPRAVTVDVNIGETIPVTLSDGSEVEVTVSGVEEERDPIRGSLRRADVDIEVDGEPVTLTAGLYNLPVRVAGVRVDCPVTLGYMERSNTDRWGIEKDVRLRFWPGDGPLTQPDTFGYPIRQKLFASSTYFDNEPVDGGAEISETVYYHSGVDFGGMEGVTEVVSATDALVVSVRDETLPEFENDTPVRSRYDVVYLLDGRGWFYRYSHFHTIDESIQLGDVVSIGDRLGLVGKEGASGGWSHLHFEIKSRQPSGKWGTFAQYALLREAYMREYEPEIIAKAQQRILLRPGDAAVLDGSHSWSADAEIVSYEWRFTDGETADGAVVERVYEEPGKYHEILKVTDSKGRVDYDFAFVQVIDPDPGDRYTPSLHSVYEPTFGIQPGDTVKFEVRAFRFDSGEGEEIWDMGDGSEPRRTQSSPDPDRHAEDGYARIEHEYEAPGDYIVRVRRENDDGVPAYTHLHVKVEEPE